VNHVLQLVDIHFLHVMLTRGPLALAQAADAADDLDDALEQQAEAGDRNDRLERIDRRPVGGDVRVFVDRPGLGRVVVAGPEHRDDAREEEEEVQREIEAGLEPGREEAVEHVAAHMAVLRQRVGTGHHEEATVQHVHEVEGPGVRCAKDIARKDLVGDE
jgi:hypothetical protein